MNIFFKAVVPLLTLGGGGYAAITPAVPFLKDKLFGPTKTGDKTFTLTATKGTNNQKVTLTCPVYEGKSPYLSIDWDKKTISCAQVSSLDGIKKEADSPKDRFFVGRLNCVNEPSKSDEYKCDTQGFYRKTDTQAIFYS
ncbi:hypothetical protein MHLP_01880 [Candidatus Mycoplasma haematolamae str. Purdue]|uniref:Ig-like domain-containing protein n=1 Tax=Mycoplasma haematolamae (strain Purdue) TaxID=1212765 RepID=I7CFH7_MYCHA|nr:hypothetical protein [Candidatus Mycoplasma haematolamae]AFO51956.1 hypothetical protein MHLP_01880 [Candidatus Mycoplasma haematolamae str. Purdue]